MQKSHWYIFSVGSFIIALLFGALARGRKGYCNTVMQQLLSVCMQRYNALVVIGFLFLLGAIIFLISGIIQKKN